MEHGSQRYVRLSGADADWFEQTQPAIPLVDRHSFLQLAIEVAGELMDAPRDTVAIVATGSDHLLRIEPQDDGKVLVKILGASPETTAAFSFRPHQTAADGDQRPLSELVWLTPELAGEPIENLNLDVRVLETLRRWRDVRDVRTIEQLVAMTDDELLAIDHIGPGSIRKIDSALRARGLSRPKSHQH